MLYCDTAPHYRSRDGESPGNACQRGAARPRIPVMLKFLLLILLISAVWYGWRYMNRKPVKKSAGDAPAQPQAQAQKTIAEDLKPCPVCGTYMVVDPNLTPEQAASRTCGRPDCRPA